MTSRETLGLDVVSFDADIESANWTKQSWDLPPYQSAEFLVVFPSFWV
jgi:hypothetical protein